VSTVKFLKVYFLGVKKRLSAALSSVMCLFGGLYTYKRFLSIASFKSAFS